jgi:putative two-component system response regulator
MNEKGSTMVNNRKVIFLVDDNPTNLAAGKNMLKDDYKVYPIPSSDIMFDLLENVEVDLILLDIEMPDMDGYEAIKKLKDDERYVDIPVIFLTMKTDEGSELEGLSLGAIDYVTKPFNAPLLLKRISNHLDSQMQKRDLKMLNENLEELVHLKAKEVIDLQNAVLNTVADLVEFRDEVTGGHVFRTQQYLELLVKEMLDKGLYAEEVKKWDMTYLLPSAQLHDVGKISISDLILNKPGKLTDEEFTIMKGHAELGVRAIKQIEEKAPNSDFLKHARLIAGSHHERWDGSGYPLGLSEHDIPLEGRLMAIADVYDALISVRPYKKAFSTDEARRIIEEGKGTQFDPALIDIFIAVADDFATIVREAAY